MTDKPNINSAKNFGQNTDGGDVGFSYLVSDDDARAEFIANDSALPHDAWKTISDTVVRVRKQELSLVNQLRSTPGLTKPLSLMNYVDLWPTVSDISGATVSMHPSDQTDEDQPTYGLDGAPLPVIHKDWNVDRRQLMASQGGAGPSLDSMVPAMMTREVSRAIENIFVNGWGTDVNGYQMYGLNNHPSLSPLTTARDWTQTDGTEDESIRNTFLKMIEALEDDEFSGPYNVVMHRTQAQALRSAIDDFGSGSTGTSMRVRINEEFDAEIRDMAVSPYVPEGTMYMYAPQPETVQVGLAEDVSTIQWSSPSGWSIGMKSLAAMNLELRATDSGQFGVAKHTNLGTA